jgi:(p)ppGpp synthase/HD superfamily hydrolase
MNTLEKAKIYARGAHDAVGQKRKYTGEPYWTHTEAVAATVTGLLEKSKGQSGNFKRAMTMIPAALGHDLLEDAKVTTQDLVREFGLDVANLVVELTDVFTPEAYPALGRAQRKRLEAERLGRISADAATIKLADLLSNTSSIVDNDPGFAKTYIREKAEVLKHLTHGDGELYARATAQLAAAIEKLGLEF